MPLQQGEAGYNGSVWDEKVPARARTATLETFAVDESASVQVHFSLVVFGHFSLTWVLNRRQHCIRWLNE